MFSLSRTNFAPFCCCWRRFGCAKIFTPTWMAWKTAKLWKTTEFCYCPPRRAANYIYIIV